MSEDKREELSEEYAAEIEKIEADAKKRKKRKPKSVTQSIESQNNRNERSTDAIRAKSAGTNRTYLRDIRRIRADYPEYESKIEPGINDIRLTFRAAVGILTGAKAERQ